MPTREDYLLDIASILLWGTFMAFVVSVVWFQVQLFLALAVIVGQISPFIEVIVR